MPVKTRKAPPSNGTKATEVIPVRLDFGCGPNPQPGFEGVDRLPFDGKVKHVLDVREGLRRWKDGSVDEVFCAHFIEHLTAVERCSFLNEVWRILKPEGKVTLIVPHWCSNRAYGDPTHQWPPISEMFFYYLSKTWRMANAPHTDASNWPQGYSCDFEATWGYAMRPDIVPRNQEYQQHAMANFKEVILDTHCTMKKIAPA